MVLLTLRYIILVSKNLLWSKFKITLSSLQPRSYGIRDEGRFETNSRAELRPEWSEFMHERVDLEPDKADFGPNFILYSTKT